MRVRSLSATALAAAALLHPLRACAQAADLDVSIQAADVVQAAATDGATTSTVTTYTLTRTVMRVVQTTTATLPANMTLSTTLASASLTLTPYVNGTASVLGTGATPSSMTTQSPQPAVPSGAASKVGLDTVGWAAVAGIAGLLAF